MLAPRARFDRIRLAGFAVALVLLPDLAADAELARYRLRRSSLDNYSDFSDLIPGCPGTVDACTGVALVDAGPPAPVLRDFRFVSDTTTTIPIPTLSGGIFFSIHRSEGAQQPTTGQGSTAAGETLRWGVVSGWSVSGSIWCRSYLAVICTLAGFQQLGTVDPPLDSEFYDLGTWSFHGTGFTGTAFVWAFHADDMGNSMQLYAGRRSSGPVIPALPGIGLVCLGGALAAGAVAALRRQRAS